MQSVIFVIFCILNLSHKSVINKIAKPLSWFTQLQELYIEGDCRGIQPTRDFIMSIPTPVRVLRLSLCGRFEPTAHGHVIRHLVQRLPLLESVSITRYDWGSYPGPSDIDFTPLPLIHHLLSFHLPRGSIYRDYDLHQAIPHLPSTLTALSCIVEEALSSLNTCPNLDTLTLFRPRGYSQDQVNSNTHRYLPLIQDITHIKQLILNGSGSGSGSGSRERTRGIIWCVLLSIIWQAAFATHLTHLTFDHIQFESANDAWKHASNHLRQLQVLTLIECTPFGNRSLRRILRIPTLRPLTLQQQHRVNTLAITQALPSSPMLQSLRQSIAPQHHMDTSSSTSTSTLSSGPPHFTLTIHDCELLDRAEILETGWFQLMFGTGAQNISTEYRLLADRVPLNAAQHVKNEISEASSI